MRDRLHVSASPRVLMRASAGAGDHEEVPLGAGLSLDAGKLVSTGGGIAAGATVPHHRITESAARNAAFALAATDSGTRVPVTAAVAVTVPAAATLGAGFECQVQADGAAVTLDGPGAANASLADGEVATVYACNGKVRVAKGASTVIG